MGLIEKAAHLCVCPRCEGHAHIIFGNDSKSKVFGTIKRGLLVLEESLQTGKMSKEEYEYVKRQIYASPLTKENDIVDSIVDMHHNSEDEKVQDTTLANMEAHFGPRPPDKVIRSN